MTEKNNIRYFDMFAGIGGFRAGLERAGGFDCVGRCEIDRHADRAYRAIHNVKENEVFYEDATKINPETMPEFDLICGGFPCQAFSVAGRRKGFDDKRGSLFFEIARVAGKRRPSYLLLENVPGLLSHDGGRTFAAILNALHGMGYFCEWQVLNSKDFGVPQSRRRLYLVGYLDKRCAGKIFPVRGTNGQALKLLINGGQHSRVYCPSGLAKTLLTKADGSGTGLYAVRSGTLKIKEATRRGFKEAGPGDSVDVSFPGTNTRRGRVGKNIAHTLNTGRPQGVVTDSLRIRRLTPKECFRLQGFSRRQTARLLEVDSDTQAYKQAGNAVTVNVVHALALRLKAMHMGNMAEAGAGKEET